MLIRTPDEITAEWLGSALGRDNLEIVSTGEIGTGQMSQNHRVTFTAEGGAEETVVLKLASDNEDSRAAGVGLGAYEREINFYSKLAGDLPTGLAGCHLAEYDPAEGWFTLVLDDIEGAVQGDQIKGCSPAEARLAIDAMAAIHAPVIGDLGVGVSDWLNLDSPLTQDLHAALLPGFVERYEGRLRGEHIAVAERFVASHDAWLADDRPPLGLVHGDFRLDNLLFGDGQVTVVDWQTVAWGPAMRDISYFLGNSLTTEDRRANEDELVRAYFDALLANGATNLEWETCWDEYRRQTFLGLLMVTMPAMVVERTDRGDEMFIACFERVAQQILDLGSLELLPDPESGARPHLRPTVADEGRHDHTSEALWNESWYADAVSADGSVGVYVRLGRLPNQDRSNYVVCVCGPDRPTVMLADGDAPLPAREDDDQVVKGDGYEGGLTCEEPLQRFRATFAGRAESFDDPAAVLRGEAGEPVDVDLDLAWVTDGEGYRWRIGERYEVPCQVAGTVRIGDETIELSGPGQRDHSWGARDWWGADWMWSAFHLEDGTHTHLVTTPQLPGRGMGYVQSGGEVTEMDEAVNAPELTDDGLVGSDRLTHSAAELELAVEPLAYGPMLLIADDGRRSHFVRAMARVDDGAGRTGTGWIEWNMNQGG